MTPGELKYQYQLHNPDGHFFDRKTMAFFGDTMRNFRVRAACIETMDGSRDVWELYRAKPVKRDLAKPHYFCKSTYKIVYSREGVTK